MEIKRNNKLLNKIFENIILIHLISFSKVLKINKVVNII